MTHVIRATNVNDALLEGLQHLRLEGVVEFSRNGPVLVAPGPVVTEYELPEQRVLFHPLRDANPVFHLVEALWMLAGQSDVMPLLPFNSNMGNYAEDDGVIHGAYGNRWRNRFGVNQVAKAIDMLTADPQSRRVVIAMWDGHEDLGADKKDIPCNTHIYLDRRGERLNMTVCCRSNDIIWGAYGANVVHFSILQELVARAVGVPVGVYRQMSNNFHLYSENPTAEILLGEPPSNDTLPPYPAVISLLAEGEHWTYFQDDCDTLFRVGALGTFRTTFFLSVVVPLMDAYLLRKLGEPEWTARVQDVADCDWKYAFLEWADRRSAKKEQA